MDFKVGDIVQVLTTSKGQRYRDTIGKFGKVVQLGSGQQGVMIDGGYNSSNSKGMFWYTNSELIKAVKYFEKLEKQVAILQGKFKKYYFWLECDAKAGDWVYSPDNNGDKVFQLAEVISEDEAKKRQPNLTITKHIVKKATLFDCDSLDAIQKMMDDALLDTEEQEKKEKEEMSEVKTGKEIVENWATKNKEVLDKIISKERADIKQSDKVVKKLNTFIEDANDYMDEVGLDETLHICLGSVFLKHRHGESHTDYYLTDETKEKLEALTRKYMQIKNELGEKAGETILLLEMCETYDQKIALLQTKKIVTDKADIAVFVTGDYVKNYPVE